MAHSWEEVKRTIERVEDAKLERWLVEAERPDNARTPSFHVIVAAHPLLQALGAVAVGLHAAIMTLIFNYLLFNWILHVNFDF